LADDHGVEHGRQVGRAAAVPRKRDQLVGEAGPAVDLDQQLGQIHLRQPRLDQLPQPPVVRRVGAIDDEVALSELRLGGRVSFVREPMEQLVLFFGERTEALAAVEGLIVLLRERRAGLLPLLIGQEQARGIGVAAAAGHPDAAGAQRGAQFVGGAQLIRATVQPPATGVDDVWPPLIVD
jgi:hypothetical protein